ncbi:hypothetical protein SNE40_018561 [Patella caerulea]|uniref:Uncharacterized protein n=1 Tax=Patella caerulea TaxID=87958 RepID=A0AAN8P440_PATCE
MEDRIKSLETKIETKISSDEVEVIAKRIVDESGNFYTNVMRNAEVIDDTVNTKVSEMRESTIREINIIIHGAIEVNSDDPSVRKQKDTA